jgi:tetratricopeptide (TPR) repeat protein
MKILLLYLLILQPDVEALLDKGFDLYNEEKYTEAIAQYDKALGIDEANPEIYFLRGLAWHASSETRKAIMDMDMAIELDPDYAEAYQQLGYIYLIGQAPDRAIEALDKAIALDPSNAETYVNRGTAKCMQDDKEGANKDWAMAKALGVDYGEMMVCE